LVVRSISIALFGASGRSFLGSTLGAASGPVVTGRIFDVTGGYTPAFFLHIAAFAMASVALYCVRRPAATAAGPE